MFGTRRTLLAALVGALVTAGCASTGGWFHAGPRPTQLVGVWVDSSKTTPTDTIAWVLAASGADRTLHVHVVRDSAGRAVLTRQETSYGQWYLSGALGDSTRQAICVKRRPRDGGSCASFRLDTLAGPAAGMFVRRLRVLGYRGAQHTRDRVLLERR